MKIHFFQLIDSQHLSPGSLRVVRQSQLSIPDYSVLLLERGAHCVYLQWQLAGGSRGNRSVTVPSLSVIWHLPRHSTFGWADSSTPPLCLHLLFLSFPFLSSFPLLSPLSVLKDLLEELYFAAVECPLDLRWPRATSVRGYSLALQSQILWISHVLIEGQAVWFTLTQVIQQVGQISLPACVCQLLLLASSIQIPQCPAVQECLFAAIISSC